MFVSIGLENASSPTDRNAVFLYFNLYEYNDNPVIAFEHDDYIMKIKDADNNVYEFPLQTVPNSPTIAIYDSLAANGRYIYKCLCLGQDIKCIISNGASKYNFVIKNGNFTSACEEIGYTVYEGEDAVSDLDTALLHLVNKEQWDYGDWITEILAQYFRDLEPMTTEEIQEVIKPGFWSVDDPHFSGHNIIYEYSEDGTFWAPNSNYPVYHAWKIEDGYLYEGSLGTAGNRTTEPNVWVPKEVKKLKDGYYLVGEKEDYMEVYVELNDDLTPAYPLE